VSGVETEAAPPTPDQARAEIQELKGDRAFTRSLINAHVDGHAEAEKRWRALHEIASSEEAQGVQVPGMDEPEASIPSAEEELTPEQQEAAECEACEKALRNSNFGADYEGNVAAARDAVIGIGGEEFLEQMLDAGLGNNEEVIRQFASLAKDDRGFPIIAALRELVQRQITPEAAAYEIEKRKADEKFLHALVNAHDLGHKFAKAEWSALFIAAHPPDFLKQLTGAPA